MIRWATLYGRLSNVASLSRKMKKLGKFGFYLEVEELSMEQRNSLYKLLGQGVAPPAEGVRLENFFISDLADLVVKSIDIFKIEVYGPRMLKVSNDTTGLFRLIQEDSEGKIAWSIPVDYKKAKQMMTSGTSKGVKISLVKIIDEVRT